jgi:NAD(P)-dependent dehydrogenase (short-subunit alcohol dehydrogenase family)
MASMASHVNEVVVVTGGSAGVGRAIVREFADLGANIAILARGEDGLEATRKEVEQLGGRALAISVDVADADAVMEAADRIERELGPIDIWVNNAMASVFAPFWEIEPDEFDRVTDVTYHGQVNGTRAALKHMRPRNRGTIVQVGSAVGFRSIPLQSAYSGAKFAIRGVTDSIRAELLHEKSDVRITIVHLPAHNTPQFRWVRSRLPKEAQPVPPIYQPEVAAEAVVWASEHYRREYYVGAPSWFGVLAQKMAPSFMDKYVSGGGWDGQMTPEPRDTTRPDNLFEPVAGDHGAHGAFDDKARDVAQWWYAEKYMPALKAVGWAALGLAVAKMLTRHRTS